MTKTENLVFNLSKKSFLSLWCYPNPIREDNGKELCDILIVNIQDVLIISIKEIIVQNIEYSREKDERWNRRAVRNSIKQIEGAIRTIKGKVKINSKEGENISFGEIENINFYRICVAFGRGEDLSLEMGEIEKEYYHVFDEDSLWAILNELDTLEDFLHYLKAKEMYFGNIIFSSEKDLCAYYILNERSFPKDRDLVFLDCSIWKNMKSKPEYIRKKNADRSSYIWDRLINILTSKIQEDYINQSQNTKNFEIPLRIMSRENRFSRRLLGKSLKDILEQPNNIHYPFSRLIESLDKNVIYLFNIQSVKNEEEREKRKIKLIHRSLVALYLKNRFNRIVALSLSPAGCDQSCEDIFFFQPEENDDSWKNLAKELQQTYGYFKNPEYKRLKEDEFPLE